MKRYIGYLATVILLGSCEDVLDKPDPNAITPALWSNEKQVTLYLNRLYDRSMPAQGFGANSANSDEAPGSGDTMYGRLTIDAIGNYSQPKYLDIREINIAIEEIEKGNLSREVKDMLQGQARVLRAWEYWELVKLYGGIPMVLTALNPYNDDLQMPRTKTSEAINIIIDDLDKAIAALPKSWGVSEYGRVTRGAAAALKSRVLLYWASPQFNPNNASDRWERAYTASKNAKQLLEQDGYGLMPNFDQIFLVEGNNNKEAIFKRPFDYSTNKIHTWENSVRPRVIGIDGGTNSNPTKQLVDAFPMANGLNITDPASRYDAVHYWKNRDPRFYSTIVYNGANYTVAGESADRKQWHYYYYTNDGKLVSTETQNPTTTGFYTRKAVNTSIAKDRVKQTDTDWIEIRFAEVLLNLAEAANEVGKTNEAYVELSKIRSRAKIKNENGLYGLKANMSTGEMREAIMLERQIEFAFENKRYWDLRRRNLFEKKLNGTRRLGIRTILKRQYSHASFLSIRDTVKLDTKFGTYFTVEPWLKDDQSAINYPQPKYNFFAIPKSILDRSPAVKQTQGWDNGSFNPYE
ncbi:hypothetical protein DC20_21435 (plasmid) [Rufibacter tibetensis]|uniref:Carbohydrate-binding protein SusD n=2 Tax=Rufibacter tibetensis TaxID=512763 RepID=A0A0P0C8I5_9BACT|nr:hypothetical protein DC20_21435 [Rufibacter tibetensis]